MQKAILAALVALAVLAIAGQPPAAAATIPDDPGRAGYAGGWTADQWNLGRAPYGVDARGAWSAFPRGQAPGEGVVVAVLDTGVAYRSAGKRFARDPDIASATFVPGRDLIDGDRLPLDENGHGTHIASVIAQATGNGLGETGLAYGASIMPVRVLDDQRAGRADDVAKGIRWAVRHGADVVSLSLDFGPEISGCAQIPSVCTATRFAERHGALVIAAAGNDGASLPAMPAAAPHVLSVSASTATGCIAQSSNRGAAITAPGGGTCAGNSSSVTQFSMRPAAASRGDYRLFGFVDMSGTSSAAAEVSAAAALVISSGVVGADPTPDRVTRRLVACATPMSSAYGAGILDAARATTPGPCRGRL